MSEVQIHSGDQPQEQFILSQSEEAAQEQSMFFDRWDGPFLRYVAYLGLPFDATDREIAQLMQADLEQRGTHVIHDFDC